MKKDERKIMKVVNSKIGIAIIIIIAIILSMASTAKAKTVKDGVELEIQTEKESYTEKEEVKAIVQVKNTNSYDIYDLKIETILPEGITLKEGSSTKTVETLKAGETATLEVTLLNKNTSKTILPQTGASSIILIVVAGLGIIAIVNYRKNKKMSKLFTLILAVGIIFTTQKAVLAETIAKSLETEKAITMGTSKYTITAKAEYNIKEESEEANTEEQSEENNKTKENNNEESKTDDNNSEDNKEEETNPKLVDEVEVGDYVNYDANSGLTTPVTYTPDSSLTGYEDNSKQSTYSSADETKWRVLSVDKETGAVELVAENTMADLYLFEEEGYINAETVLNDIGAVYGKGKGATGGRSINIEDIEQYSSFDPSTYKYNDIAYGETKEYTSGKFIKTEEVTGGVVYETDSRLVVASESNPVTVKQSYYDYETEEHIKNETVYNMLFKDGDGYKYFWLASRCVDLKSSYCLFGVRIVTGNGDYRFYRSRLWYSNGNGYSNNHGVLPVVSLQSNIQTSGKDESGAWNLVVE